MAAAVGENVGHESVSICAEIGRGRASSWMRRPERCLGPVVIGETAPQRGRAMGLAPMSEQLERCLELGCDATNVRVARAFVQATLRQWEMFDLVDSVTLIASELASNAVLHARSDFGVTLRASGAERVRIEVSDENPRLPTDGPCPPGALSGRGLGVVDTIARSWGVYRSGDGKVVWAEVGEPDRVAADDYLDLAAARTAQAAIDRIADLTDGR